LIRAFLIRLEIDQQYIASCGSRIPSWDSERWGELGRPVRRDFFFEGLALLLFGKERLVLGFR
jgi:hypothetical protein